MTGLELLLQLKKIKKKKKMEKMAASSNSNDNNVNVLSHKGGNHWKTTQVVLE